MFAMHTHQYTHTYSTPTQLCEYSDWLSFASVLLNQRVWMQFHSSRPIESPNIDEKQVCGLCKRKCSVVGVCSVPSWFFL
jgi:hypothetical protein